MLVPLAHFDLEHLFRSKFVKLLCIFSHSVTIPIQTSSRKALTKLLGDHCIEGVWKKGTDYYKVSLPGNCTVSDIDLSAF